MLRKGAKLRANLRGSAEPGRGEGEAYAPVGVLPSRRREFAEVSAGGLSVKFHGGLDACPAGRYDVAGQSERRTG